ncbi:MAG: flavodoxin FldA [Tannerellaceae bacterium]|jgi:flavodoxin I|nr:flavodoxin FldA [Tannerellaceae bacterium]
MKKTGLFFGSSSGTTEDVAQRIAKQLGVAANDIYNVSDASANAVEPYEVLILGTSTWGSGDLQDDWDSFLPKLKKADLSGKSVAIFGTGDSSSFSDTFCDGIGILYNGLKDSGAVFGGAVSADGYDFDDSAAMINGSFIGLPLDEVNEDSLTGERITQWTKQLKTEFGI